MLPELAQDFDVLLSGHGLDYTFEGIRRVECFLWPAHDETTDVEGIRRLVQVIAADKCELIDDGVSERFFSEIRDELRQLKLVIETAIVSVDTESPYDAWDAYILLQVAIMRIPILL